MCNDNSEPIQQTFWDCVIRLYIDACLPTRRRRRKRRRKTTRPKGHGYRLTASSTGHICNDDIFARSIEMKCVQWILVRMSQRWKLVMVIDVVNILLCIYVGSNCLADFVHPRELQRLAGTYFPYLTQSVIAIFLLKPWTKNRKK